MANPSSLACRAGHRRSASGSRLNGNGVPLSDEGVRDHLGSGADDTPDPGEGSL